MGSHRRHGERTWDIVRGLTGGIHTACTSRAPCLLARSRTPVSWSRASETTNGTGPRRARHGPSVTSSTTSSPAINFSRGLCSLTRRRRPRPAPSCDPASAQRRIASRPMRCSSRSVHLGDGPGGHRAVRGGSRSRRSAPAARRCSGTWLGPGTGNRPAGPRQRGTCRARTGVHPGEASRRPAGTQPVRTVAARHRERVRAGPPRRVPWPRRQRLPRSVIRQTVLGGRRHRTPARVPTALRSVERLTDPEHVDDHGTVQQGVRSDRVVRRRDRCRRAAHTGQDRRLMSTAAALPTPRGAAPHPLG